MIERTISDRMETIIEICKVISKEEARAKAEQSLEKLQKEVASFDVKFNQLLEAELPNWWGANGELLTQQVYNHKMVEIKSRTGAAPERTPVLKGETITNFL